MEFAYFFTMVELFEYHATINHVTTQFWIAFGLLRGLKYLGSGGQLVFLFIYLFECRHMCVPV